MREIGVLVWVVFIVIGVVANIASAARKQSQANAGKAPSRAAPPPQPVQMQQAGQTPAQVLAQRWAANWPAAAPAPRPQTPQAAPVRQATPVRKPAPAAQAVRPHETARPRRRGLFADKPSVVRAVIAAEVLGKPRALRDE